MSIEGDEAAPGGAVREQVMEEARGVAERALERLRGLSGELPEGAVEQVERLHRDPASERRKAARLGDAPLPVSVRLGPLPGGTEGAVRDHSPSGLSVLLPCPAGVGTVLRLRLPEQMGGWVTVEVRHCRREAGGWVAGCELAPGQPPL